ncbi:MAG: DivIVA domain-containing protein [Paenibacillus sp.]|uniref:DivIVA domain-containing protein n=1 Tax=Paenibacillus aquistagni TaxID=1852522 RepID=A0A1X7IUI3_9BACL|nr:DivIVA domain-containing protein [Paenibacillus aquistagni]MBR2567582.1 DivIVA domain-containing protein [Paenibacillus sp.]NMM51065.1 DivIVA domain-containing protein [Paenibacillus aquistagni]SMG18562.1 DivIVA domain-containing protein [Paenibacillus aquistagni]
MSKGSRMENLSHLGIDLSAQEIHDQEFNVRLRGYDTDEVNEYLDRIIRDYDIFYTIIQDQERQIKDLKARLDARVTPPAPAPQPIPVPTPSPIQQAPSASSRGLSPLELEDIMYRLRELEKKVFGSPRGL